MQMHDYLISRTFFFSCDILVQQAYSTLPSEKVIIVHTFTLWPKFALVTELGIDEKVITLYQYGPCA